jgi:hypothetical protein
MKIRSNPTTWSPNSANKRYSHGTSRIQNCQEEWMSMAAHHHLFHLPMDDQETRKKKRCGCGVVFVFHVTQKDFNRARDLKNPVTFSNRNGHGGQHPFVLNK